MQSNVKENTWSLTRARIFYECPRRYYYQYHYARIGFGHDIPQDAVLASEMSSIQSMDMWVGDVVHQTIEWILQLCKSGDMPSIKDAESHLLSLLSWGWKGSMKKLWRNEKRGVYPNLFEHYYEIPVGKAVTDRLRFRALMSIKNFMESDLYRQITLTSADAWLPIEKYASFRLNSLLLYVKFDFAMRDNDALLIYDWKTGKVSSDEKRQLTCYAMYTSEKWRAPIEKVRAAAVHLQPEITILDHTINDESIEDLRDYIMQSFNAMLKCLRDPQRQIAAIDDFPMTGNLLRCSRCNFRGLCEQAKAYNSYIDSEDIEYDE